MPYLLSQILSTNYQIRTYVEAMLVKLYRMLTSPYMSTTQNGLNAPAFLANLKVKNTTENIYHIIKPAIEDKDRNASKMLKTFAFQYHPLDDYSIETIYSILPSLFAIVDEELINYETFAEIILGKRSSEMTSSDYELDIGLPVRLRNLTSRLGEFSLLAAWQFAPFKDEPVVAAVQGTSVEDLQKKIIPWQCLVPDESEIEDQINRKSDKKGICRTCEIFGVKELVLSSLRITEDKLFRELAVTADKWLNIKEVPEKSLTNYLLEMKLKGYSLVGIEQTANSKQLNTFVFPEKSVLVLG